MKATPPNPPTGPSDSANASPSAPTPTAKREVSFEYSPQFPQVLQQQHASLLVSTYQAGKLCVIGVREGKLTFAFHNFDRVMGVAVSPIIHKSGIIERRYCTATPRLFLITLL